MFSKTSLSLSLLLALIIVAIFFATPSEAVTKRPSTKKSGIATKRRATPSIKKTPTKRRPTSAKKSSPLTKKRSTPTKKKSTSTPKKRSSPSATKKTPSKAKSHKSVPVTRSRSGAISHGSKAAPAPRAAPAPAPATPRATPAAAKPTEKKRSLMGRMTDKVGLTNRRYNSGKELQDKHLQGNLKAMSRDTENETFKGQYKKPLDKHGAKTGFFKPDVENISTSKTAVASSKVGKFLRINPTTADRYATHNGKKGVLSPEVKNALPMIQQKKGENGGSGKSLKHDLKNAKTQKGLAKLQLHDAITGQEDRHGGNIYINPNSGKVTGIDNDRAFNTKASFINSPDDKYTGLPQLVDKKHGKRLMRADTQKFQKMLDNKTQLDDLEKRNAVDRFKAVKQHVKGLHDRKELVGQKGGKYAKGWGEQTYNDAVNAPLKENRGQKVATNYVQRGQLEQTDPTTYLGANYQAADIPA